MTKPTMKFKAQSNMKDLLTDGAHVCKIKAVSETASKESEDYKDRTPQIEVSFETKNGFIRHWYNLKGFKKNADGTYVIDKKTGMRVKDSENTAAALAIFERLGLHAGIAEGQDFGLEDLINQEVGIFVKTDENGKSRVTRSMPAEKVTAEASEEIAG